MKHWMAALALGAICITGARGQRLSPECDAKCSRAGMSTGVMLLGVCSGQVEYKSTATAQEKAECDQCLKETCRVEQSEEARIIFPSAGTEMGASIIFKWTKGRNIGRYRLLVGWDRGTDELFKGELTRPGKPFH